MEWQVVTSYIRGVRKVLSILQMLRSSNGQNHSNICRMRDPGSEWKYTSNEAGVGLKCFLE